MNSVASQHSQSQSLLNTPTISGSAGIADHNPGASSTSISNQQALQDSTPTNDTNLPSDNPTLSESEPSTTTTGRGEALVPKEQPPGDKEGEVQGQIEPVVIKEEGEVLLGTVNGQIELLEHTPEASVGSGDADVMVNEDAQDWIPDADHELKRVKVCQSSCSRHFLSPIFFFLGILSYSLCSMTKTASFCILPSNFHIYPLLIIEFS